MRPLPPEIAEQWEVGAKAELFDKRLTATIAYYDLTKQHIAVPDPNPILAQLGYQTSVGAARNRGFELDIAGEIVPGWKVIASYSYIASIITKDSHCDPSDTRTLCIRRRESASGRVCRRRQQSESILLWAWQSYPD